MKKNFKGFTLIELIVVIAIIGVLAAILVPAMMGWVRKASINSANSNAKSVFTNAQTIAQEWETQTGNHHPGVTVDGTIGSASATGDGETSSSGTSAEDRTAFIEQVNACMTSSSAGATWAVRFESGTSYVVQAAIFSSNGRTYTGGYPGAAPANEAGKDWASTNIDTYLGYASVTGSTWSTTSTGTTTTPES